MMPVGLTRWVLAGLLAAIVGTACSGSDPERVVVAAGTTVVDSGLVERLIEAYRATGADESFSVVGVSTAEALSLGASGGADLLITHQEALEDEFLAEHPEAIVTPAFTSRFLLAGPADEPPALVGAGIVDAFTAIAADGLPFVTRRDGSGTYAKEQELWALAGIDPVDEQWYTETGQGMGFTLQVADQRSAYVLTEDGAYRAAAETLSLVPVDAGAPSGLLDNPYRAIVVDADASPAAHRFIDWLSSDGGRDALLAANGALFGELVYSPPR